MSKEAKTISKDLTWKGLRMELPAEELQAVFQQEYEYDKYYDFDLLLKGIYKALNKEIDFEYFKDWCVLIANCFYYTKYKTKAVDDLVGDIAWFFDGISFDEEWDRKRLLYQIAVLKDFNHELTDKSNKSKTSFETNGVERILVFDHANWTTDSSVYKVIIKDNKNKQFDKKYVDDAEFEFDEHVNYSFVEEDEFAKIFNSFYNENEEWKENHNLKF